MIKKILPLILLSLFLIIIAHSFYALPQSKTADHSISLTKTPLSGAFGDVNDDGFSDILLSKEKNVSVFYQQTDGSFSSSPDLELQQQGMPDEIIIIDIDYDDDLDVITANNNDQSVSIFLQDSGTILDTPSTKLRTGTNSFPKTMGVGYFNDDDHLDIVVACSESYAFNDTIKIFFGPFEDGQHFDFVLDMGSADRPASLGVGDFNRDLRDDIILTNRNSNKTYVYYQNLSYIFPSTPDVIINSGGQKQNGVAVGDLNRNSYDDVAICVDNGNVSLFFQNVSGLPNTPDKILDTNGLISYEVEISDVNNDGRNDVVVATFVSTKVFYQKLDGTFPTNPDLTVSESWDTDVSVGRINQDYLNDILVVSWDDDHNGGQIFYQDPPPLDIAVRDILIDDSYPRYIMQNKVVNVKAVISNDGLNSTENVTVRFFVDGEELENKTILQLKNQSSKTVTFTWKATPKGEREIKIEVDEKEDETSPYNNWNKYFLHVTTPDLTPVDLVVEASEESSIIKSTIRNIDDGDAYHPNGIEVRFYDDDPGGNPYNSSFIDEVNITETIQKYSGRVTAYIDWPDAEGNKTLWVWVDPFNRTIESNYENNKKSYYLSDNPYIGKIRPYYQHNKYMDVESIFVLSDIDTTLYYKAFVSAPSPINRTVFTLTGPGTNQEFTDRDGSDGWNVTLNLKGYQGGDYTLSVQAFDKHGLESNIVNYSINVLDFPDWIYEMGIAVGPFKISFSDGVLCFEVSSSGWGFFNEDDDGAGSGDDPLSKGKTKSETNAEVSVKLCSDCTGEFSGSAGGEANMVGKGAPFLKKIEGGISANGTIDVSTFELIGGRIKGYLSVTLEHLYGIVIPVIDKGVGVKIQGQPGLSATYDFRTINGEITDQQLTVTVNCYIQGGFTIDVYLGGAEVYGYADPSLSGYIPADPHPFSIEVAVGAGGGAWLGPYKWEGKLEAAKWTWPSSRNVTYYNWTQSLRPKYGTNQSVWGGNNISNDMYFDDYPYVASDYASNVFALWVTNTTIPDESEVMYSIFSGINWTSPEKITDNQNMESYPAIAFDSINNKGVAVWEHNKGSLTRNTTYAEFIESYKDNEIYFSIYNSTTSTWGSVTALTNNENIADILPTVAADSFGNIMTIWVRDYDGNISTPTDSDIFYSIWNTSTESWTPAAPLPQVAGPQEMDTKPVVAFNSSGYALAVWVHDENSSKTTFEDYPPEITELFALPNPAQQDNTVTVYAKVIDDMVETQVTANITFPDESYQLIDMPFNATSGYYEGAFTATQNGNYSVAVNSIDYADKEYSVSVPLFVGAGDSPPVINDPFVNKSLAHINNVVTISANVTDNINVTAVWANITGASSASIELSDADGDNIYTGNYTPPVAGTYNISIHTNDSIDQESQALIHLEALDPIDTEIYRSQFNPSTGLWTNPTLVTDKFDYQESTNPTAVYDSNDTAVIAWQEKIGDPESYIYTSYLVNIPGFGTCDCQIAEQAANLKYGNREPKLIRSNNGFVMLTWRADDSDSIWSEIFYSVLNSTRLVSGPAADYCTPVWGEPYRLSYNSIPDWKPTVTVDPYSNMVTAVWLGHFTDLILFPSEGDRNFTLYQHDDDLYYEHFSFPFRMTGLNEVTRFADGSTKKTLVFDNEMQDQVVTIEIPDWTFPRYDARMKLEGLANSIDQIPTNVTIDLGSDGDTDLFFDELDDVQTYYLNAVDCYQELDGYLQNTFDLEDGEPDGRITVPLKIHSDTSGRIRISEINIGFDFVATQRNCDSPIGLQEGTVVIAPSDQLFPRLYSDRVTYQDLGGLDSDVYVYNLTEKEIMAEITSPGDQEKPVISGDRVAYQDNRNGNYDIFYYDIIHQIEEFLDIPPFEPFEQMKPDISDDSIVYQDNRNGGFGVYLYNIDTGLETEISPFFPPFYESINPAIHGEYVVWQQYDPGTGWNIWIGDKYGSNQQPVTTESGDQINPALDSNWIVWQGNQNGTWDIYLYNITAEEIIQVTDSPEDETNSSIHNDRVTWEQGQSETDIYLCEISFTGGCGGCLQSDDKILITSYSSNQTYSCIYEDTIVWEDDRLGNKDVFSAVIQIRTEPNLDHIEDITVNETELIRITANAIDLDGDDLVYFINDSRFSHNHNEFEWQTVDGDIGTYRINITVDDCRYNDSQIVNITILDDNKPPVINPIANITVNETETVEIIVFATDINDDELFYAIDDSRFDQDVNTFTWETQVGDFGDYTFIVNVSDGIYYDTYEVNVLVNSSQQLYYITTLADGSSVKNLIFNTSGDIVEYFSIPKNTTVLSAIMNLTGLGLETGSQENIIFSDDFDDGDISDWTITLSGSGIFEASTAKSVSAPYSVHMKSLGSSRASGVSPSYDLNLSEDYNASFNFLVPNSNNHWFEVFNNHQTYIVIDGNTELRWYDGNDAHDIMTLNPDQWYLIELEVLQSSSDYKIYVNSQYKTTADMWNHSGLENNFQIGDREPTTQDYGEAYWDDFIITQGESSINISYPTNPNLDVGNDSDIQWNYTGVFDITETIPDFSVELNEFLANCTPVGDNCTVSLVFHSDSAGIINISDILIIYTFPNQPPDKPLTPSGPTEGETWILYNYSASTTDPDGDAVYYMWDWDDGNMSEWLGPYPSGETCNVSYYWTTNNTYNIRVKAKDTNELESEWSDPLPVFIEEGFYLNLFRFPMYEAEEPYNEMCGPAVAQMTLNYIWWNSSNHSQPLMLFDNQTWLYERGIENNTDPNITFLDTRGLWYIIQYNKPMPYQEFGYNFMKYGNEDLNEVLKRICLWINYTVGTVGGHKEGHPLHVPAVVPAYGNYTNWMAIRGFHANRTAHPMPDEITIYGFWVNDPFPGGIGENSYKMLATWVNDYYQPLVTNDTYNGKYVAIFEPPETNENAVLTIGESRPQFTPEQQDELEFIRLNKDLVSEDLIRQVHGWIIQAAIEGVAQELIPYDDDFASTFKTTIADTPMFIESTSGNNYYAVPFNVLVKKSDSLDLGEKVISEDNTIIVILIDAEDGSFKEASWTKDPVKYLPISEEDAQKMVYEILEEMGYDPEEIGAILIDLIHRDSTLYYPDWRVTIEKLGLEFFIKQDGTIY